MTMKSPPTRVKDDGPLYERVAEHVAGLIARGTLRTGQRIPSVRRLKGQLGVSVATVLEAYRRLEDRGLIEARPQSGYYVRPPHLRRPRGAGTGEAPPEPAQVRLPLEAAAVECVDLVMRVTAAAQRPDLVPLGAAVPAPEYLPTEALSRLLARAVRRYPQEACQYDFPPGCERLRREVARRLIEAGCTCGAGDLLLTSGATEAIMLCLRTVTRPGDTVAVESPSYYGLFQLLEALGLRAVEVPASPRHGLCIQSLEGLLRRGAPVKAVVLGSNVQNPLGGIMPDENKRRLSELLGDRRVPVIEDDTYGDLAFSPQRPLSLKAFDRHDNVLLCGSFSKTLAPGYRAGWVVPGRYRAEVQKMKLVLSLASASPTQLAVAEFLASGGFDRHLRRLRRVYQEHLRLAGEAVARHFPEGTRATRPAGGNLLWVELPEGCDSLALHEAALARGISIAPGPLFSASGRFGNCLRLNCAVTWSERVEGAIATLGELAKAQVEESGKGVRT
jgi:DNA-binding transcriptional MocR family regulator